MARAHRRPEFLIRPVAPQQLKLVEELVVQADADDVVSHMGSAGGACRAAIDEGRGECRVDRDREGFGDVAQIDVEIFSLRRPAASKPGLDARPDGPTDLAGREISRAVEEWTGLQGGGKTTRLAEPEKV